MMLKLKLTLSLCVIGLSSIYAQGNQTTTVPDSILHVTKIEAGVVEFRAGSSPILAVGMADPQGKVHWNDLCQRPFPPGQISTVADRGGSVGTVVTANGVYGNKAA